MPQLGPYSPTGGSGSWTDPDNVVTENGAFATTTVVGSGTSSPILECQFNALSFPAGAEVTGAKVRVLLRTSATAIELTPVQLRGIAPPFPAPPVIPQKTNQGQLPTTLAFMTVGGDGDLWGESKEDMLAVLEHGGLNVQLAVKNTASGTRVVDVDFVELTAYYVIPLQADVSLTNAGQTISAGVGVEVDADVSLTNAGQTTSSLALAVREADVGLTNAGQTTTGEVEHVSGTINAGQTISASVDVLVSLAAALANAGQTTSTLALRVLEADANVTNAGQTIAASAGPKPIYPGQPVAVSAVRSGDFLSVSLTWPAAVDAVSYEVRRADSRRSTFDVLVGTPTTESQNDAGLTATLSYVYKVRSVSETGHKSPWSPPVFTTGKHAEL